MGRKKERPAGLVKTSFYLGAELHRALRVAAAEDGEAVTRILERLVTEFLSRRPRRRAK